MTTPRHLKPALAAWIQGERNRLKLKPKDIVDRLAAQGLDVTEATIKVWESNGNRRPSVYNLEGLERIFGSPAPSAESDRPASQPDSAAIIEAIDRQTDMLEKVLTVLSAQTIAPDRLRALEVWMDWMAANPLLPPQSARRRAKQPPAPNP